MINQFYFITLALIYGFIIMDVNSFSLLNAQDIVRDKLVGSWDYFYRKKGNRISTDDILLAYFSLNKLEDIKVNNTKVSIIPDNISYYSNFIDLGTGIGSTLLLLAYNFNNFTNAYGIEVQLESYLLLNETLFNLNQTNNINMNYKKIKIINDDLRNFSTNLKFDLITLNPPFLRLNSGTIPNDIQRRNARFEFHGSIEDYLVKSKELLNNFNPNSKILVSYPSKEIIRIENIVYKLNLYITKIIKVIGTDNSIFEIKYNTNNYYNKKSTIFYSVDISKNNTTGELSNFYKNVLNYLSLKKKTTIVNKIK